MKLQPVRPQGPLPPVLQTKQFSSLQGPAQGLVQMMLEIGLPLISITLYLQPRVLAPFFSTSLHILASWPPGVHGQKRTVEKPPALYQVAFFFLFSAFLLGS